MYFYRYKMAPYIIFIITFLVTMCCGHTSKHEQVDIIVFPECGLSTIYLPENRSEIRPLLTRIPDPEEFKNPCLHLEEDTPEILQILSCAARNASIYVVVNLPELSPCSGTDCPPDGAFFYNTNIVFDRSGTIIARYRKFNLFGEPGFDITPTAELSTFDTDFNVRFGLSTCFDIYFHDPIMQLVKEKGITDIAFPVAWFSEIPFITAIQVQEGWARTLDINLLAAGYDDPANRNGGSGIYAGRKGKLTAIMPLTKTSRMLISRVPKKNIASQVSHHASTVESEQPVTSTSERLFFSDYLAPYTTQLLQDAATNTTICDRGLCCKFEVRTENVITYTNSASIRLVVFNGIRPFFGGRTGGIQVCSIITCSNSSLSSCGQPVDPTKQLTKFDLISIKGNFNQTNSIHVPNTLKNTILPLDVESYTVSSRNLTNLLTHVHLRTIKTIRNLWTFGIYSREYDLDDLPFTLPSTSS
ncbi:vanin-like protein 1 isoform X2 [Periplaneta americana]|uniref:vanin-like protein 1 isoform X2 n=1 Tax=Periplaneta americana TaxID=6978 RepID=UPI0037E76B0E